MNLTHLNDEQRKAVEHTKGPLLLLAGAGSGKTRVLTHRIAYLVEELGVSPYHILSITFTNKAAREMKERIHQLLGDGFRDLWVSTFHSSCVRILRSEIDKLGYSKNFVIYDTTDQQIVIKECLKKLNLDDKMYQPRAVLAEIGKAKDQLMGPKEFQQEVQGRDFRKEKIATIYEMYQNKLRSNNALDFDDLIMKTVQLFLTHPPVLAFYQEKFKYILVDEFQDTNMAQYTLVSLLAKKHHNLCVVGDDDQSIYGWRGADIRNILGFEKDFPNTRVIKLEQNYRSTKNILSAANAVVAKNSERKDKKLWTDNIPGEVIQYYKASNEYDEAGYITNAIDEMKETETRSYNDFAILYRTNAQSRTLEELLMKKAIPYRLLGGTRFYDRKEIRDILAYLKIIENPVDDVNVKRIINVPKRGIGLRSIEKLEIHADERESSFFNALLDVELMPDLSTRVKVQSSKFTQMITSLRDIKDEVPVTTIVKEIYKQSEYIDELHKEDTVEAKGRIENLEEFLSLTKDFDENAEIKTLEEFLARTSLETSLDLMDEDEAAVVLMTLHSAKGLEFPVVFIPGMEEGIFPSSMSLQENNEEEERRLCYVGITRAMEKLYLSHAMMRTLYGRTNANAVSRFIREIPEELITMEKPYNRQQEVRKMQTSPLFNGGGMYQKPVKQENITGEIKTGMKIKHPKFGVGTVVAASGEMLTIAFPNAGIKKISTAFTQLEVIK
ncbi:ATP-dependent DNA helicase PcrA [Alkaliphilus metalliredigens QYMF]|uniref:ATP-dependent DNA helicase n=1 Tax=Alkaliphilus metalliredigens (strain QYMF) TaxID=293826 RepID=A6TLU3_ALKMQ|nr:DNA helicase PcrA [Alkaliphilus metalliredigens]ABR47161.1 ATP-dependent DNA helicase PcrA [Alkaliphilus metalliredigens QYMF]